MTIRIVLNWDNQKRDYHLTKNLRNYGHEVFQYSLENFNPKKFSSKTGKLSLLWKYWLGAYKAVKIAEPGDILIGTNFHVGALLSLNCSLFRKKNKILGFNLIMNDKPKLIYIIRAYFLKWTFKNRNFYTTVNDKFLIELYNKYFIGDLPNERFLLLNDHYINPNSLKESSIDEDFIFTGGENSRDWKTLFKAASLLPEIKFICVARKRLFPNIEIPVNVKMYFDTSYDEFLGYLKKCSAVALPLCSEGPAGLLVIFDSAFLGKPVITTQTRITQNYIENDQEGILIKMGDYKSLAESIQNVIRDKEKGEKLASSLKEKLDTNYSIKEYAKKVNLLVKQIAIQP